MKRPCTTTKRILGNLYRCDATAYCPDRQDASSAVSYCGVLVRHDPKTIDENFDELLGIGACDFETSKRIRSR